MRGIAKLRTLLAQRESKFPYDRVIGSAKSKTKSNTITTEDTKEHKGKPSGRIVKG